MFRATLITVACLALLATPSIAKDIHLVAMEYQKIMPDSSSVTMWGYAEGTGQDSCDPGYLAGLSPSSPGPAIEVLPGDVSLRIFLTNCLDEPTSIVIPGQEMPWSGGPVGTNAGPTWTNGASGSTRPGPNARVRSFGLEAGANGGTEDYRWTGYHSNEFQQGSFVYHSGTHPSVQVQMGLYGAATRNQSTTAAYPGEGFHNQVTMFYSEIDPAMHQAVADGSYGTTGPTSTIDYTPKFYLVNGEPFIEGSTPDISALVPWERNLVRFYNAGLKNRVALLDGGYFRVVAEDGRQYPNHKDQYSVLLPALKSVDAFMVNPDPGRYSILDRSMGLTNDGQISGYGGALRILDVKDGVKILRVRYNAALGELRVWADSTAAPTHATDALAATLTLDGHGPMDYLGNDNFDYRLFAPGVVAAPSPCLVTVTSDAGGSDSLTAPASCSFTADPTAADDSYQVGALGTLNVAAAGVLANDSRGGYFALTADGFEAELVGAAPVGLTLNADGSFTYDAVAGGVTGPVEFTYRANATNLNTNAIRASSNVATVRIMVNQ